MNVEKPRVFAIKQTEVWLIVALGLYWAWSAVSFFGIIMFPQSQTPLHDSELLHFIALLTCAILTLLISLAHRFPSTKAERLIAIGGCLSASLGSFLTICSSQSTTLLVISAIITGVGEAAMLYRLCLSANPALGVRNTLFTFSSALLISTILYGVLYLLGGIGAPVITACLPLAIFTIVNRKLSSNSTSTSQKNIPDEASMEQDAPKVASFPWQLIIGFSIFGVAFGLIRGIPAPDPSDVSLYYLVHQIGRAATGIVVIVVASKAKDEYRTVTVFGIACFASAFLITYQTGSLATQLAINLASTLGYTCFELLMWAIIFAIISETNARPNLTYGLGRGCMQIGIVLGTALTLSANHSLPNLSFEAAFQISIVAMMLVVLGCFDARSSSELWGMRKKAMQSEAPTDEELQKLMSEQLGLSPRECNVAIFLTKGRSEPFIAEALFVSRSTVHSHITSIYSKTNVHSRQEFLSLVEGFSEE